jgi:hypothetical protein
LQFAGFGIFDLASLLESLLLVITQHIFSASRPADPGLAGCGWRQQRCNGWFVRTNIRGACSLLHSLLIATYLCNVASSDFSNMSPLPFFRQYFLVKRSPWIFVLVYLRSV